MTSKIIAEVGVNWSGDISIAKSMIVQSKRAGADFVKFQMFNSEVIKDSKYKKELSSMILDSWSIGELYDVSKLNKIKFGVSTMYPEAFGILENTGIIPDFIKIRFADRNNDNLAQCAVDYCREYDTKLIVSVQDFFIESFDSAIPRIIYDTSSIYKRFSFTNYMYCIPKYPPALKDINKEYISNKYFHGYSNHFPSKYLPMIAVFENIDFVEIHIRRKTCNKVAISVGLILPQIDENVSIDFGDLEDVCQFRNFLSELNSLDCYKRGK